MSIQRGNSIDSYYNLFILYILIRSSLAIHNHKTVINSQYSPYSNPILLTIQPIVQSFRNSRLENKIFSPMHCWERNHSNCNPFWRANNNAKMCDNLFNMISIVKILKIKIAQISSADQGNVDEDNDSETENSEVLHVLIKFSRIILVYYCKCCNLIGYSARYLFIIR